MSSTALNSSQGNSQPPAITITAPHRESLPKPAVLMKPPPSYNMFPTQPATCGGASHNRDACAICGPGQKPPILSPSNPASPFYFTQMNPLGRTPPKTQSGFLTKPKPTSQICGRPGAKKSDSFDGWMAKFCVEPEYCYDIGGCCLSTWVPCAQYGKTHWRLEQVDNGRDASNAKWKSKDGCNGPCWAWYGLCCLLQCDCILTGLQRTRIRATYGIKGNIGNDLALSFFCRPCALLQMDREVRAREGDQELCTNSKAPKAASVGTQPAPNQEMRYVSPRQTVSDNEQLQERGHVTALRRNPQSSSQQQLPKLQPRSEQALQSPGPDEYHLEIIKAAAGGPSVNSNASTRPLKSKAESTAANSSFSSQDSISPRSSGAPRNENVSAVNCSSKVFSVGTSSKIGEQFASKQQAISFRSASGAGQLSRSDILARSAKADGVKNGEGSSELTIIDNPTVVANSSRAAMKQPAHTTDPHELSYVHDFSEAQVDKNILEYFEKQEIRSQLPDLTEVSPSASTSDPQPNNLQQPLASKPSSSDAKIRPNASASADQASNIQQPLTGSGNLSKPKVPRAAQHDLADCPGDPFGGYSKIDTPKNQSASTKHQHALNDGTEEDDNNEHSLSTGKSQSLKQHALANCDKGRSSDERESTKSKSQAPEQHSLADCTKENVSKNSKLVASKQHALADCDDDKISPSTPGTPGSQSRRASTGANSPTIKHPQERQHRLASCPVPSLNHQEERTAINESGDSHPTVKPSNQHGLHDCGSDANNELIVPIIDGESQSDKLDDVAGHPRKSRYRKEVEITANFNSAKRTSQAHKALKQALASHVNERENSQTHQEGLTIFAGNSEQEKGKGKADSQEEHKSSGFASMFSKIGSSKNKKVREAQGDWL